MAIGSQTQGSHGREAGQPPKPKDLPLCVRCLREGGIVLYGNRKPPQRAVIVPLHIGTTYDESRGKASRRIVHKGPREPLCSHHVELVAWETNGQEKFADDGTTLIRAAYPAPAWRRPHA